MPPRKMVLISQTRRVQLIWVMNLAVVGFFTVNSLGTCIVAALLGKDWQTLSITSKFLLVVVILVNWSTTMMAFLNRSINHLLGDVVNPLATENLTPAKETT